MAILLQFFSSPIISAIGWTLIDFVWQGLIVGVIVAAAWKGLQRNTAQSRYLALCMGLMILALSPIVTLSARLRMIEISASKRLASGVSNPLAELPHSNEPLLKGQPVYGPNVVSGSDASDYADGPFIVEPAPITVPLGEKVSSTTTMASGTHQVRLAIAYFVPWAVCGWLIGVVLLTMRLLFSWKVVRNLRQCSLQSMPDVWQERVRVLAIQLHLHRPIKLVQSARVEVPTVLGCFRPMILLPMSVLTGLEPDQLASLLAHELAHIRRHDYLVNLIQTVVETILFYHPAVWWISSQIREEREHCCDDIAVKICGDRMVYARALTEMEGLRSSPQLTLAANSGSLMNRIQRIVNPARVSVSDDSWSLGSSGLAILLIAAIGAGVLTRTLLATPTAVASQTEVVAASDQPDSKVESDEIVERDGAGVEKGFAEFIGGQAAEGSQVRVAEDIQIAEPRTILEFRPLETKVIQFKQAPISLDGHDLEVVEMMPISPTQFRLKALKRGVTKMVATDDSGRRFLIWIFELGGAPLSDFDRIKLLAEINLIKMSGNRKSIELTSPNFATIEFPNRLRSVDRHDPDIINVRALAPNQIQIQAIKSGVTEMTVVDEMMERFLVNVVVCDQAPISDASRLKLASEMASSNRNAIRTAHLKLFRTTWIPKQKRTIEECASILQKHSLSNTLDEHRQFVQELIAEDLKPDVREPWSDCDLYVGSGNKVPDWIHQEWDPALYIPSLNLQNKSVTYERNGATANLFIDPDRIRNNRNGLLTIDDIFYRKGFRNRTNTQIRREDDLLKLVWSDDHENRSFENDIDERVGYSVRTITRDHAVVGGQPTRLIAERHWLGWQQSQSGIPYPRKIIEFRYREGILTRADILFVQQATFNVPIDATTFEFNRPAGPGYLK